MGAGSAHLEGSGMPALIGFIFVPFILSSPIDVLTKRMLFMAYELWEDSKPLSDGTTNFRIFTIWEKILSRGFGTVQQMGGGGDQLQHEKTV